MSEQKPEGRYSLGSGLEKYLSKVRKLTNATGLYAYRGQEDSKWPLRSAATRRLIKKYGSGVLRTPDFQRTYLDYHVNVLIEPARSKGFGVDNGRDISELELLAKLQHLGTATGLLDFSWSPLMALCIACQDQSCDGKVFLVDTLNTVNMTKVTTAHVNQEISQVLLRNGALPELLYYEPVPTGEAMPRIIRQRSVFVIGHPLVLEHNKFIGEIRIARKDKPTILADLELLDFSYQSLFQDIYGFAEANSVQAPLAMSQVDMKQMGNSHYQDGDYSKAVDFYTRFTIDYQNDFEVYFLRGNAYAASRDHEAALRDYSQAIELSNKSIHDTMSYMIYFNRANSKSALGDLEGALGDYDEAIRRNPEYGAASLNRANTLYDLGRYCEAITEYDRLDSHLSSAVHFNKGNTLVILGKFEQALNCYEKADAVGPTRYGIDQNIRAVRGLLEVNRGHQCQVRMLGDDSMPRKFLLDVEGDSVSNLDSLRDVIFAGHIGNTGNIGGPGLEGGEGFEGRIGFSVLVGGKMPVDL